MDALRTGRKHTHTLKRKQKCTHTCIHAHTGTAAKAQLYECEVLPQVCMHVLGASSDKNMASVPH